MVYIWLDEGMQIDFVVVGGEEEGGGGMGGDYLQGRLYWLAGAVKESPRQYG